MRPLSPQTHEIIAGNTPDGRVHAALRASFLPAYSFGTWPRVHTDEIRWLEEWAADDVPVTPGVILCGGVGVGKTGLMVSALSIRAAFADGDRVLWHLATDPKLVERVITRRSPAYFPPVAVIRWTDYLKRYRAAERDRETEDDVLTAVEDVVALGVDDVGVGDGRHMSDWREELLLDIALRAERGLRTVITTNVPITAFVDRFGHRVADRFLYPKHFTVVTIKGESLREQV